MSNVISFPSKQGGSPLSTYRIHFDYVPRKTMERLFFSAIHVGWAAEADGYNSMSKQSKELLTELIAAVNETSIYCAPIKPNQMD